MPAPHRSLRTVSPGTLGPMGVRLRFGVFSVLAAVAVGATALAVACGGDDGGGPGGCTGADCDGGASSDSTTGSDTSSGQDGNVTPADGGTDGDADSSVVMNCGDGGAPGTLDETFGDGGLVVLPFSGGDGRAVLVQPDGKIVVAGKTQTASGAALTVVRLLANGSLDATFGTAGAVERVLGGSSLLHAIKLQPDGKIIVAGYARPVVGDDFAVLRYLANGTPDSTFGDAGVVFTDFSSLDQVRGLVLLPDGRIVAAGYTAAATGDMAFARYNADGTLDTTFGGTGKVTVDLRGTTDQARGLALLPTGKLIAAGTSRDPVASRTDLAAVRLAADGMIDTSFADGGAFWTAFGGLGADTAEDLGIDAVGRIVATGLRDGNDFGVVRLTTTGTLDPTFGTNGSVRTDFAGRNENAAAVLIQEDGKIVVVGSSLTGTPTDSRIAMARYLDDGGLDTTFGTSGQSLTPLPSGFSGTPAHGAAIAPCGLLVVGTWTDPSPANRIGVARYRR